MIAFNEGLLDAGEPGALPGALQQIIAGLEHEPVPLDAARDEWLLKLGDWLGTAP